MPEGTAEASHREQVCLYLVAISLSSLPAHVVSGKTLTRPGATSRGQTTNVEPDRPRSFFKAASWIPNFFASGGAGFHVNANLSRLATRIHLSSWRPSDDPYRGASPIQDLMSRWPRLANARRRCHVSL